MAVLNNKNRVTCWQPKWGFNGLVKTINRGEYKNNNNNSNNSNTNSSNNSNTYSRLY
jgi:hypothetical protein